MPSQAPSELYAIAAWTVLLLHMAIVVFNIGGMIAIPLGAWRGWAFVRRFGWRLVHLLSMATVAFQAVLGEACFLTLWQAALEERGGSVPDPASGTAPLLYRWVNALLFWPLPLWVFAVIYVVALIYVLALWRLVPPRRFSDRR